MNTVSAKQLIQINSIVTGKPSRYDLPKDKMKLLKEIAAAPFEKEKEWDSVNQKEYETCFYEYRTVIEKAAKLGCDIYQLHPFESGNNKTAVLALLTLLDVNSFNLEDYFDDLDELVTSLQNPESGVLDTASWIKNHMLDNYFYEDIDEDIDEDTDENDN